MRVAIVGFGPKGLFALERLIDHVAHTGDGRQVTVDIFDPVETPGAGPNYDPAQPEYLRMNFAAGQLDAWWPGGHAVPTAEQQTFVQWRDARDERDDEYPSRAVVGRYLDSCHERLLLHAPANVRITSHRETVTAVTPAPPCWHVATELRTGEYDEVLIASGHERADAGGLGADWNHAVTLVDHPFPVRSSLSRSRLPAGSTVAVRGFALTFIDVALTLTEGRGGSFTPTDHPHHLAYRAGSEDVATILPFSRSGRPMLAKPHADLAASIPSLGDIAGECSTGLMTRKQPIGLRADLVSLLARAAAASLLATRCSEHDLERLRHETAAMQTTLLHLTDGIAPATALSPVDEVEHSLDIGAGLAAPDAQWALGHTWRAMYPALVARLGADGLAAEDWPAFRRLANQMERIAFGPPALNAAKFVSLVRAGRIDLSHVAGGRLYTAEDRTALWSACGRTEVDVVVDAVLPEPGAHSVPAGLLADLVRDGHARLKVGRRGLEVAADGTCTAPDGTPTLGLSAIGRPTEDCAIGNDTLSRTLHPLADLWAARVAARSRAGALAGHAA